MHYDLRTIICVACDMLADIDNNSNNQLPRNVVSFDCEDAWKNQLHLGCEKLWKSGSKIRLDGQNFGKICLLKKGSAKIVNQSINGLERVLLLMGSGSFMSELSFFGDDSAVLPIPDCCVGGLYSSRV